MRTVLQSDLHELPLASPSQTAIQVGRFTSKLLQTYEFPVLCLHHTTTLYRRPKLLNAETQVFYSALSCTACKDGEEHHDAVNMATTPLHVGTGLYFAFYFDFCNLLQDLQLHLRIMVWQVRKGFQAQQSIIALHRLFSREKK